MDILGNSMTLSNHSTFANLWPFPRTCSLKHPQHEVYGAKPRWGLPPFFRLGLWWMNTTLLWIFDGQLMGSTFSGKTVQKFQGSSKKYPGEVLCPFNISIDYAKNTSDLHQISAMDLPTPSGVPTNPGGDFLN